MNIQEKGRNNKKKFPIVLKALLIMFFVFICAIIIIVLTLRPKDLVISNIDLTTMSNGVYIGSADNGLVKATVSVEVNNGMIQNITILEHDNLLGKPAEKIVDDIIEQQSLEVDAISSATYSSNTIRKAVENALREGE